MNPEKNTEEIDTPSVCAAVCQTSEVDFESDQGLKASEGADYIAASEWWTTPARSSNWTGD